MSISALEIREARAQGVQIQDDSLVVHLVDGRTIIIPLAWYPRLWYGRLDERQHFEILGDGAYVHWPDLDEDLSIDGIVAGHHSGECADSLKRWLSSRETH
jgi:hypothetical protein